MGSGGKKTVQVAIETTSPKTVLQVFHNVALFGKEENNARDRERLCRWQNPILSHCGAVDEETLLLPSDIFADRPRFERSDLVILNDECNVATANRVPRRDEGDVSGVTLLQLGSRTVDYEIFQLRRSPEGLELHLAYSRHASYIGRPRRSDYQIARLEPGRPLRVTINGKIDFSLSSRRARSYLVRDYLFLYLGDFSRFAPGFDPVRGTLKKIALAEARHVDLREILY